MNIKQASQVSGVSADTIRYYEKIGLIHPVKRLDNGNRSFDEEDLKWIGFAKQMRSAGMSITVLTKYLELFREGEQTVPDRKLLLESQINELQEKVEAINEAITRLEFKLENYDNHMIPFEESLKVEEEFKI